MRKAVIYARVSTNSQECGAQINELREYAKRAKYQVIQEFLDTGHTGKHTRRPAFKKMMELVKKRKINIILVWKLDRLSRSMKDLVNTVEQLEHYGVDLCSYDNQIDTSSPGGKLLFHIMGAVAEFEREIISERVKAGLRNAKRKGVKLGRPKTPAHIICTAEELRNQGMTFRAIGAKLGISEAMVRKGLKEGRIPA
jgi:DNA invertase Pin-like site-specific DNA recombinase